MQKWGQVRRFQAAGSITFGNRAYLQLTTASGLQVLSQFEQGVVRILCQEAAQIIHMIRSCQADKEALRWFAQNAIECHAHREVAGAAQAARCNAGNAQARVFGKDGIARRQSFEDEGSIGGRVQAGGYCCLARLRSSADDERGGRHPLRETLPGSTPSCFSLR